MAAIDLSTVPPFYHNYIRLAGDDSLDALMQRHQQIGTDYLANLSAEDWDYKYAPEKWTVKDMVQHLIDAERIFSYRALCFSRGEMQSLPGFDENEYVVNAGAERRSAESLLEEWGTVTKSTALLYASLSEEQMNRQGMANGRPISVKAIGYITAGHLLHHLQVLRERYFPQ